MTSESGSLFHTAKALLRLEQQRERQDLTIDGARERSLLQSRFFAALHENSDAERRSYPRIPGAFSLGLRLGDARVECAGRNLSIGGARVVAAGCVVEPFSGPIRLTQLRIGDFTYDPQISASVAWRHVLSASQASTVGPNEDTRTWGLAFDLREDAWDAANQISRAFHRLYIDCLEQLAAG